jgi:hypothetical protein
MEISYSWMSQDLASKYHKLIIAIMVASYSFKVSSSWSFAN